MKKLLGAIAAAVLLGTGCAHDSQKPTQSEMPSPPQASVGNEIGTQSLSCQVIGTGGSGEARSEAMRDDCVPKQTTSASASTDALGGSAPQEAEEDSLSLGVIDDSNSAAEAIGGSATSEEAIGGSPTSDAAFEDTGMGSAGGGGG